MFREVARKKQIIPREECIELLINEPRGVLSVLGDDEYPYGMPMNHYYCEEDGKLYFHGGKKGHKSIFRGCIKSCIFIRTYYETRCSGADLRKN